MITEWDQLRKAGCWDESDVQEWDDVAKAGLAAGTTVHVGRIFEIWVENCAELTKGDPSRKFKGRVVYQGNNMKDDNYDMAIFSDLFSAPC